MDIGKITNSGIPLEPSRKKAKEESGKARPKEDKVELSEEAKSLFRTSESKRLEEIQNKIQSGYYFQHGVTEMVVDALMRDLKLS